MPDLQTQLDLCTYCPRLCSHTCPVSLVSARESLTPQAKMQSFALLKRALASDAPLPASAADPSPVYGCTGCGACTVACLYKVEPGSSLMRGRVEAERADLGAPVLARLPQEHRRRAEQTAAALAEDPELAARAAVPGGIAYLPTLATGDSAAEIAATVRETRTVLRVLDRLRAADARVPQVGVATLRAASAGYPLYAAGFSERFRLFAESLAREVDHYAMLLVGEAKSAWLLRVEYPEHGVPLRPEVRHIAEYLGEFASSLPVTRPQPAAYYHDACHLGRKLRCYEGPRALLARALVEVRELVHHHDESVCCGAGGLLPLTEPEIARGMARERLAERESAPAGPQEPAAPSPLTRVISACPSCAQHLGDSAADGDGVLSLLDVLDAATTPAGS